MFILGKDGVGSSNLPISSKIGHLNGDLFVAIDFVDPRPSGSCAHEATLCASAKVYKMVFIMNNESISGKVLSTLFAFVIPTCNEHILSLFNNYTNSLTIRISSSVNPSIFFSSQYS